MRRTPAAAALALACVAFAAPASSAAPPARDASRGPFAHAAWEECASLDDLGSFECSYANVSVNQAQTSASGPGKPTRIQPEACLSIGTYGYTEEDGWQETLESGCTTEFEFELARDLATATLTASVPVDRLLCDEWCEPTGETRVVDVFATWTATGGAVRDQGRGRTVHEELDCTWTYFFKGITRGAAATAVIDGTVWTEEELSWWSGALLGDGMARYTSSCFL